MLPVSGGQAKFCPHTVLYGGKGMGERGGLLLAAVYASYIEVLYNFFLSRNNHITIFIHSS